MNNLFKISSINSKLERTTWIIQTDYVNCAIQGYNIDNHTHWIGDCIKTLDQLNDLSAINDPSVVNNLDSIPSAILVDVAFHHVNGHIRRVKLALTNTLRHHMITAFPIITASTDFIDKLDVALTELCWVTIGTNMHIDLSLKCNNGQMMSCSIILPTYEDLNKVLPTWSDYSDQPAFFNIIR